MHQAHRPSQGIYGLSGLVESVFQGDVLSGHLVVFLNRRRDRMKILAWDHDGLMLIYKRLERGKVAASPSSGVNSVTGEGLANVLVEADVFVDVTNSPSFEDRAVLEFFETSTRNLLAAEADAGVGHHVALSIVGCDGIPKSG